MTVEPFAQFCLFVCWSLGFGVMRYGGLPFAFFVFTAHCYVFGFCLILID